VSSAANPGNEEPGLDRQHRDPSLCREWAYRYQTSWSAPIPGSKNPAILRDGNPKPFNPKPDASKHRMVCIWTRARSWGSTLCAAAPRRAQDVRPPDRRPSTPGQRVLTLPS
jgi:hypothetical protein